MEDPLIGREGIGRPTDRIFRRSEAITHGSTFQKAAALVDLAEDGIGLPEEILDQSSFEESAKYYFIFTRLDLIWSLNYFALICLNFFERPLWCDKKPTPSCSDRDYYYLGQLPYLTNAEAVVYEVITLVILLVHTFFPISYEGSQIYWKSRLNLLKVACAVVLAVDVLVDFLYLSPLAFDFLPFRIAPYVRVLIFILSIRELRDCLVLLAGMLGTYLNILALWLLFLLFASWIAYVMFEDTQQGLTLFNSYSATLYQMFILFTTSNNPDVWIPAYKSSRWSSLFFILYVLIGVYFVTNLILAVVYDSFKEQLTKQVSGMDLMKRRMLEKAFHLIDKDNTGAIDKEKCILLFEALTNYRTLPKISKEEFGLIFDELDDTRDFKINKDEFADLCHAIALRFQKEEVPSLFENLPQIYHSPISKQLRAFVRSPYFGYVVSFILVLNLIAVIVETTLDIQESSAQKTWQVVEFVFGWIYVLEMALKIYSYGFENYWRDGQNRFDFIVTWVIVIGETLTFVTPDENTFFSNGEWIRYLLLARMLRLIRLLMYVQRYRAFIATFITLVPSLMPYLGTIFCILCVYCSIGLQIFGGIVNAGNKQVATTDMAENDYLLFNFNDYPNGMVTLFNLLVMGNWQAWMESYRQLTGTWWSITYFISFYIITVLLLLNLVVAFVLEAFFAELDLEEAEKCQGNTEESEERGQRRRYSGTKSRSQRVDALLHHMLGEELNQTQCSAA
ncbi:PREDICTED: two pore calcium channel protein 1-like [Tarenaya hassleriana]|uniref:two pore calcium channel protein 1-like n=1 Tax=Tarenaya hassleriana TaxID=28532 RepID=UPI00053C9D5A|nr:PREDICTED: two pore calcium channel protein 1-like [Tarenaya hassleriana]